jgi:ribA/ribD-fused uncharacterized protein
MTLENVRTREALIHWIQSGGTAKYVFFWGHTGSGSESIGKHCFSQWYPAEFETAGHRYATAEHFMMAEKARLFGDLDTERKILAAKHPAEAKRLGREVRGFDDALWTNTRMDIVVRGNRAKFAQNPALSAFLASTAQRVLVEASPSDRIWGIGVDERDARATTPEHWPGLNLLGFALMAVRAEVIGSGTETDRGQTGSAH